MLTEIKLTNFKCFKEETAIPLSKFNLFTGVNGAGKSTALQALLLMRQSIEHNPYTTELILNGSCVLLGSFDDVRNRDVSPREPILFEFEFRNQRNAESSFNSSIHYQLKHRHENMSLHISKIIINQCCEFDNTGFSRNYGNSGLITKNEDFFLEKIQETSVNYDTKLNLSYIEGRPYQLDSIADQGQRFFPLIKLTPHFVNTYSGEEADQNEVKPLIEENPSDINLNQVFNKESKNKLSCFSFNGKVDKDNLNLEKIHFISADRIGPQEFYLKSVLSNFRHVGSRGESTVNLLDKLAQELINETLCLGDDAKTLITQTQAWLGKILNPLKLEIPRSKTNILELFIGDSKPSNVGFGYTSILPIIVTGLIAKPGEKIIIENPEIHLHPKAQSALIEFLVKVANTGVQIFIESHSDHVLNALRLATKNQALTPEDVNILFFTQENGNPKVIKPSIDQNGRISQWPEDFFDETAKSLASLVVGQQSRTKAPKG